MDALAEENDLVSAESSESLRCTQAAKKRKRPKRVVLNVSQTKYPIIRQVARSFNWRLSRGPEEDHWNILRTDGAVCAERLARMKAYQRNNHFPGTHAISRNCLLYTSPSPRDS